MTIRGEIKRAEEEQGEYYYREMSSGAFSRTVGLARSSGFQTGQGAAQERHPGDDNAEDRG